ncbi:uncharacterized protein LOC129733217 isoform X2 [Wyeomyia smithii]|uniref:uncharacterized protein LOC129733217 isoform X2 n=1 Tax=Wyeomyia smithii TaxID=174621 RepID=UPI00246808E7|nr:uncharacterized protein LOC129733217 isoform X2 [Wyeomyia smithii]
MFHLTGLCSRAAIIVTASQLSSFVQTTMSGSADLLTVISPADWPELRDLYRDNWPCNLVAYHTVDNFIRWHRKDPSIKNLTFYSLNNNWRTDGTYVIVDRYQLFVYTLAPSSSDVVERALHLLDWNRGFKVSSLLARHRNAVINVIEAKGLRKEYDSCTYLYHMPKEESARLDSAVPDGFRLGTLTEEDVIKAEAVWPNKHVGSLFLLKRLAAWNPNVALYNPNGDLVAWCFRLQAGALGALQVDEKHLKKGYGTIVTIEMAKKLASINEDCFALVNSANIPSKRMFEKLGFRHSDYAYWLRTYPTEPFQWTDE